MAQKTINRFEILQVLELQRNVYYVAANHKFHEKLLPRMYGHI
jgi:hypothetical protein